MPNMLMRHVLAVMLFTVCSVGHGAIITTTGSWDGISGTCCFGEGSTDTYGQTFTVAGSSTVLNSFSFWINDRVDVNAPIDFAAYLMEWHDSTGISDPRHPVGPLLFSIPALVTTNNSGSGGMEGITFNTGGIELQQGKKYVAFISSSLFWDGVNSSGYVGSLGNCCDSSGDVYSGGEFVLISNGNNFLPFITESGWNTYPQDLAFSATFSTPVPIPSSILLMATGLVSMLAFRGKKKQVSNNKF